MGELLLAIVLFVLWPLMILWLRREVWQDL